MNKHLGHNCSLRLSQGIAFGLLAVAGIANAAADTDTAADRKAILAMQCEYTVDFAFDETVLLTPGYERAPAMRSGGNEVVFVEVKTRSGDIITEAGQQKVTAVGDLEARIAEAKDGGRKSLLLLIRRDGEPRFVALSVQD